MPFSCSKFSLFFERVDTISEGATLDCSNGVFRHYDEKTHLCLIHKKRPLLCRVAAYYDALQSTKLSREEWYWLNEEAIRRLQEEGTTKMGQRPLPYDKKNRPEGIIFFEMYPLYWTPSKEGTFCVIRLNFALVNKNWTQN